MGRTPDRYPGVREEEGILLRDAPSPPSDPYTLARVGGKVQAVDDEGEYDPRAGSTLLGSPVFGVPTANQVLVYNATLDRWQPASVSGVSVFGTEYQHDELLALAFTTSGDYVQRFRWTTSDLAGGSYFATLQCTLDNGEDAGVSQQARIQLDDTTTIAESAIQSGVDFGGAIVSYQGNLDLSGVHFFDFDWRKVAGKGSAGIRDIHCALWRAV